MPDLNLRFEKEINSEQRLKIKKDLEKLILILNPSNARLKIKKTWSSGYSVSPINVERISYDLNSDSNFKKILAEDSWKIYQEKGKSNNPSYKLYRIKKN